MNKVNVSGNKKSQVEFEPNNTITYDDSEVEEVVSLASLSDEDESTLKMPEAPFKFLIIDCSPINFIDYVGARTIVQV